MSAQLLSRVGVCAIDDEQLVRRALEHDAPAFDELMRRYDSALREAARDGSARLSDTEIEAAITQLWRSLVVDEMRGLRAFTPGRGAHLLSWLTIRLAPIVLVRPGNEISDGDAPTLMRVEEVARRWGIDRKTVYSMISNGQLAGRRCGRLIRIPRKVIESFELQASVSPEGTTRCR